MNLNFPLPDGIVKPTVKPDGSLGKGAVIKPTRFYVYPDGPASSSSRIR